MSYTNGLDNPELYFQCKNYVGSSSAQSITLDGSEDMQPDFIWFKNRETASRHQLYDSVRGTTKLINSDHTDAEQTVSFFTSFDSDGFTIPSGSSALNGGSQNIIAWCWKAGGSASSNSNGSITSSVSANQTAGFSIVSYTGTGSQATVGHGLGVAPSVLIHKKRTTSAEAWSVFHQSVGITKRMILSSTEAATADASPQPDWNDVLPTSSVFTIGTSARTNASENYICYAFAEKKGYSKFGSYTGNGNADGVFIYTGFKPAFIMFKRFDDAGRNWWIFDNKRDPDNDVTLELLANTNGAEDSTGSANLDFLSNGIKLRTTQTDLNGSGGTILYMAFAELPFVNSNGVPTNAR
jgi:hypothetical protein